MVKNMERIHMEIGPNEAGQRLDKFLKKYLKDVPLSAIYKALRKGDIRVNGKKGKETTIIAVGDAIEIRYIQSTAPTTKKAMVETEALFKVTYEDENLLLVEKWPGILVHGDQKSKEVTLTDQVLAYLREKGQYDPETETTFAPSPVNRLDRNTSGIVIYGKNYEALKALNEMMRDRDIEKIYVALVKGRIADGVYTGYIEKDRVGNKSTVHEKDGSFRREIRTQVTNLQSNGLFSFVELDLLTGRSHQLRAHLAALGHPIVGDAKYGDKEINDYFKNKFALHFQYLYAYKVTFKNPPEALSYLKNKVVAEKLPPIFKSIRNDVFKFDL